MRTILVSAFLLLSTAFLVCRLLKKKEPRIYLMPRLSLGRQKTASLMAPATESLLPTRSVPVPRS